MHNIEESNVSLTEGINLDGNDLNEEQKHVAMKLCKMGKGLLKEFV